MKAYLLSILLTFSFTLVAQGEREIKDIFVYEVNSSINPGTFHYLNDNMQKHVQAGRISDIAVLIKLNTPGGLVSTTKDILTLIGKQTYPVFIWITPEGASATSAGAIIAAGAHKIFMSPGTNIGASTPIQMSGDIKENDAKNKAVNDLVALTRSLSESRGRNPEGFEKMISEAKSYTAQEAQKLKIIDYIINSRNELVTQLEGTDIQIKGEKVTIKFAEPRFNVVEMNSKEALLNLFANPSFAYILFLIGIALLYFEFQAPGGFIAGAVGVICLILAGISFQVLPLNFGALALIIASLVLFVLEIYITSFGILSLAGLAALVIGSMFLFDTPDSLLELNRTLIFSSAFAVALYLGLVAYMFFRKVDKPSSFFNPTGESGVIYKILEENENNFLYQIKAGGSFYKASSSLKLTQGDKVKITGFDQQHLEIDIHKES